jgi:hypothetical protein
MSLGHQNFRDEPDQSTAIEVEVGSTRIERLQEMEAQRVTDRVIQDLPEVELEEPAWYIWISYTMLFYYGITFVLGLVFLVLALAFAATAKFIMIIDVLWCIYQILLWNNAVNAVTEVEATRFDWLIFMMRINFLLLLLPLVLDYTFDTNNFLELAKLCALDPILYEVLSNSEEFSLVLAFFILVIIPGYFYFKTVALRKSQ